MVADPDPNSEKNIGSEHRKKPGSDPEKNPDVIRF